MRIHFLNRLSLAGAVVLLTLIIPTFAGAKTLNVPSTKYATIQAAVNAASPGDTIQVSKQSHNVPYSESVTINTANLTLNASSGVVLDGGGSSGAGNGFTVTANNVTIQGFTIQNFLKDQTNPAEDPRAGINDIDVNNLTINNVTSNGNDQGCYLIGTVNLLVENSTFTNNLQEGIRLVDGTTPTIIGNTISGNAFGAGFFYAVVILGFDGSNLTLNNVTNNGNGISISTAAQGPNPPGIPAPKPAYITGNYVSNNPGESITVDSSYLVTVSANLLSGNLFGMAFIDGSLQCTASLNVVTGTTLATEGNAGILVTGGSTSILVTHNDVENNLSDGIDMFEAIGNTITYNIARHNTSAGSVDASDDTVVIAPGLNTWAHNIFGVTNPPGLD